ncbi:MAG: prenyltransferase/squalene oxidase repeat-containing protein [Phycisphaeraceae bacterium]|nr:prenyltransferase/squalene oxidase repeat-containing protein [Phycisphaeraceae bacterium]
MKRLRFQTAACLIGMGLSLTGTALADKIAPPEARVDGPAETTAAPKVDLNTARTKGMAWLVKHQAADGSWGKRHTIAITSFACLSFLSASDEPFDAETGKALTRGLQFLLTKQKAGMFEKQGHTWIHGQGFGTLALSEAYGRTLFCKIKPDMDVAAMRKAVAEAVQKIAENQSTSGCWWYTPSSPSQHEGSTTVCAVQALVSADNFGIDIDKKVLRKGFRYLKKCQNPDGGFDYQLGPGTTSMKGGTAGGVATLGLMKKFDYTVMMNGHKYLQNIKPAGISADRFCYYGHFYAGLGMRLLGQEMKQMRKQTGGFAAEAARQLAGWQQTDGHWPLRGWMKSSGGDGPDYATAFATLTLSIPEGRLSIFNRDAPELPEAAQKPEES